jgi:prepilin-type N-terminal cleavage/methylation domain-containing protein
MNSQRKTRSRQAGFSLLELTVTMGIMVIILGVVSKLMADALRTSTLVNETTEAQQSLRAAHEIMTRDLLTLGDGLSGLDTNRIQVPLNFVKTYITPNPNGAVVNAANSAASYVPLSLVASDNDRSRSLAVAALLPLTDRFTMLTEVPDPSFPVSIIGGNTTTFSKPNANTLVANVPTATAALFKTGEVVMMVSATTGNAVFATVSGVTTGASAKLTFTSGDGYGLNTTGLPLLSAVACPSGIAAFTPCTNVSVMRVQLITYFVAANGLLRRRVLGNPRVGNITDANFAARALEGEVIAEHISELQVRYGLTNPASRTTWQHVDQLTLAQQPLVRELEVKATAETPHEILKDGERAKTTAVVRTSIRTLEYRCAGNVC